MFSFNKNKATLIAEIGGNHEGDLSKAKDLMFQASASGADIVKFQSYSGAGLVNKKLRPDRYEHFKKFMLTDEEWLDLAITAKNNNILFSSSIWEEKYFHLLDEFICLYKIGSGDINNFELMKLFLQTKKPFVFSTAMSTLNQIKKTFDFITEFDNQIINEYRLAILQCTAMYDEPNQNFSNLLTMLEFKNIFKCLVGYSNHAVGINSTLASIAMGASVIEFHYTDSKDAKFRDHKLSFDSADLLKVSEFNNELKNILGSPEKTVHYSEKNNEVEFRRGVFLNKMMSKGDIVSIKDLVFLRPEVGISMWDYKDILGKKAKHEIQQLEPLNIESFEE